MAIRCVCRDVLLLTNSTTRDACLCKNWREEIGMKFPHIGVMGEPGLCCLCAFYARTGHKRGQLGEKKGNGIIDCFVGFSRLGFHRVGKYFSLRPEGREFESLGPLKPT
jgi:hypothetical protein